MRILPAVLMMLLAAGQALAQSFPSRPVTLINPLDPGGSVDVLARAMGRIFTERNGVNVLVENRPGANFIVAANTCARARPDGYTICMLPRDNISVLPFEQPLANA